MRNVAFVAGVALVTILFIGVLVAVRAPQESTALASRTATFTRIPSATPTAEVATPRVSASPTPAPTPSGTYVNQTYKFAVVLPLPYRKSAVLSLPSTGSNNPAAHDAFTGRTEADEARLATVQCETACEIWNYVAVVEIYTGISAQTTPREWYTSRGGSVAQKIEDVTVDRRPAIRVTDGGRYPMQLVVKDGERMFVVAYQIYSLRPAPPGASKEKLDQILASFRFVP